MYIIIAAKWHMHTHSNPMQEHAHILASAIAQHTHKHAHIYKVGQVFGVGVCTHTHAFPDTHLANSQLH